MKFFASILASFLVVMTLSYSPAVKSADVGALLAGICDNVAADNKGRFRKKLKEAGVKLRDIYDGISCGGQNLVRHAIKTGSAKTGAYIVKRMPASHFAGSGDAEWATGNGFADSPIVTAIAER
ncbi:hypothetical protein GCM10008107_30750 [Psychrosphaera saromensis]|uniref:DUF3718 domain-containing protein n=1 Tax=Psychrosphaera saromensis TaxID=716813 RepID=A0A2S7UR49_9GAMM|nr:DUF3718 domain-containing protein [Psychrosphaera saromensis]PQJ52215.1 hypothetical protein BTO11_00120 [Psychrosphaera saromensis]GHB79110.1 hypothetical protein GCM10008107_30750 [Psychrosphaera saromensis]GLQ13705.1 hypothetical protein GCM10007917_11600 [Psychrosphaera saromensis]